MVATSASLQDQGITLEANKWHHAAVKKTVLNCRLFIDGVIKDGTALSGALTILVAAFTIGADAQSNYHFHWTNTRCSCL